MSNPLLEQTGLPAFSKIQPEHVEPAVDELLAHNRRQIADLLEQTKKPGWHNLIEPIELLEDRLERIWRPTSIRTSSS